jgi:hypothetical protein
VNKLYVCRTAESKWPMAQSYTGPGPPDLTKTYVKMAYYLKCHGPNKHWLGHKTVKQCGRGFRGRAGLCIVNDNIIAELST